MSRPALNQIPAADFEALVGQPLTLRLPDGVEVALLLESVWNSPYATSRPLPGFALRLRGPLEPALGQGLYVLCPPAMDELTLFMTPIGRDAQGMRYEIVFN